MVLDLYNAKGKLKIGQVSWTELGPKKFPAFLSLSTASTPYACFTPLLVVHGALCRCFSHTVETFSNGFMHIQALLRWEKEKLEGKKCEFLDESYFL